MTEITKDKRDSDKWHMGKEIPIAVLIALFIAVCSNIIGYFVFQANVKNYMTQSDAKFTSLQADFETRFLHLNLRLTEKTDDRIKRKEVLDLLAPIHIESRMTQENLRDIKKSIEKVGSDLTQFRRDLFNGKNH